ncbi:MAG: hypothetical protein U9O24_00745 [Campylobacterota bacterium]|nr:hypothetical protein [Campylobacterota bacterium]
MIINKSSTFISGIFAFSIYFMLMGLLILYFNTREEKKPINYVKKDEKVIQVALSTSNELKSKTKNIIKPKPKLKPKVKPKKEIKKKVIKEKIVKKKAVKKKVKKKDINRTKPKKKPLDLFANVKTEKKKNYIQLSDKPKKSTIKNNLIQTIDKPKSSNKKSGVEDAYLAKVQSMLEGWPAQSEYAGEKVKVLLYIRPSGNFEFKLKTVSYNEDFNIGLTYYLEQLQDIGFGSHNGQRTYKFEAEFIAKE